MEFLLTALGLIILVFAGDALVRGAVNMSLRLGVPALLVSLTVVAFGTSAPELLVSIGAVLSGSPGLALGNVVGSNIANVLLVLGAPAVISGLATRQSETRRSYWIMLGTTLLFIGLAFVGPYGRLDGLVLLAVLAAVLGSQFLEARTHRRNGDEDEVEGADPNLRWPKILLFLVLGLVGLPLGADLLVDNARIIAERFGVSDAVIGLTLVALGTSLPELATTVMAAIRRQSEVALGNVIGSNMFNLLGIVGVTALVGDIPVERSFLIFDLWVMLASSLLVAPFVLTRALDMTRIYGVIFVALYLGYLWMVVT